MRHLGFVHLAVSMFCCLSLFWNDGRFYRRQHALSCILSRVRFVSRGGDASYFVFLLLKIGSRSRASSATASCSTKNLATAVVGLRSTRRRTCSRYFERGTNSSTSVGEVLASKLKSQRELAARRIQIYSSVLAVSAQPKKSPRC